MDRSYLKKVFSPDIGVEASFQVPGILEYACGHPPLKNRYAGKSRSAGLILGFALISNENPNFEMASIKCRISRIVTRMTRAVEAAINYWHPT